MIAPSGAVKGLSKVFDTGAVPNPAFVDLSGKQPAATTDKVQAAVVGFGARAIGGWTKPAREPFTSLASRMNRVVKAPVLATPDAVRIDGRDMLIDPTTLKDSAMVAVKHHFVRPPGARME